MCFLMEHDLIFSENGRCPSLVLKMEGNLIFERIFLEDDLKLFPQMNKPILTNAFNEDD